eukprot:2865291-Pyramimonas_sp.AAC.1
MPPPVDKMPSSLAISCLRSWQLLARAVLLGEGNVCRVFPCRNSIHHTLSELQPKLPYAGLLPRDVTLHQVGSVDVWPKAASQHLKVRP